MKLLIHTGYYVGLLMIVLLTSCLKKDDSLTVLDAQRNPNVEDSVIRGYLIKNNIDAIKDPSGLYYKILYAGDSLTIMKPTSIPTLIFSNTLMDGKVVTTSFGPTDFERRQLKDHILGWQIGLQRISKGGRILLIIPPGLAFGPQGIGNLIPGNAVIVSNVELVDFK
jgi:FKBP-type peptidyl-prolyl cis-trans isomerase FkpA